MRVNNKQHNHYHHRKIIHIDMDCFFAAVEIRDNPALQNKPVAVAGSSDLRGVVTTCNYEARKFGVRSAMPSITAKKLCPNIVFVPVNINKYRDISKEIQKIYKCYTKIIEPISLDEAYLDVTNEKYCNGNPEEMAQQIRSKIYEDFKITASAGISSNKLLAKIASDWNKPNGQFHIRDSEINNFIFNIPIRKIVGVGEKTEKILQKKGLKNCSDVQKIKKENLIKVLGKYGGNLYYLCRGIDNRDVESNKTSKSLSVEDTFMKDLHNLKECTDNMSLLYEKLIIRLRGSADKNRDIKSCFVKIKFNNFKQSTAQKICTELNYNIIISLLTKLYESNTIPVRLLGVGINFGKAQKCQLNLEIF